MPQLHHQWKDQWSEVLQGQSNTFLDFFLPQNHISLYKCICRLVFVNGSAILQYTFHHLCKLLTFYNHWGGKWKTNGWKKDCDDCYMCKSPWMIWCPGAAWLDSFPASGVRCVYWTLTWSSQDLIQITHITSPIAYLMALLRGNFHFVIHVIWKSLIKCMIMQPRTGCYWAIHPTVLSETEETLFQQHSAATPTPSSATWGACL